MTGYGGGAGFGVARVVEMGRGSGDGRAVATRIYVAVTDTR